MAWRVARGLFRLWLVLSVLWIGGVGVVTWRTFPVNDWIIVHEVTDPELLKQLEAAPRMPMPEFDPSKPHKTVVTDRELRAIIQWGIALALVPPAFVLALGSALVWAFRGFRQP